MATLENEYVKVSVQNKGAEITSLYSKVNRIEHLWQADAGVWAWHAPNLFPVIGESVNKQLLIDGQTYPIERHGFARHTNFALETSTVSQALFSMEADPKTIAYYPFRFKFLVEYQLAENKLAITYRIKNLDEKVLYFSVGGHPAFNVPFLSGENYHDYYLQFESDDKLDRYLLADNGLFNGQTEAVVLDEKKLYLTKPLFEKDALVFKKINSRKVTLKSRNHPHSVSVEFPAFDYLGIWAKPGADFVCIEPWLGCADTEGKPVDIQSKEAIQNLVPGATFEASFSIILT
jgi:galactose mutarotase-like enzyme